MASHPHDHSHHRHGDHDRAGVAALLLALHLPDSHSVEASAAPAGPVDVLFNNAGESQNGPLEELPMEPHDQRLDAILTETGYRAFKQD